MQTFVAAVEAGSFTNAADRLGVSKKLVSKYVGELEHRLGLRLLHRTTRRHSLTGAGERYYRHCLEILDAIDAAEAELRQDSKGLSGKIRVAAPTTFGEMHLVGLLADFQKQYQDVVIDLRLSDHYVDLAEAGFDLAIRIGSLDDSALMAKRLSTTALWTVASPGYLSAHPEPKTPEALISHACIHDGNLRSGLAWSFSVQGTPSRVTVSPNFIVDSAHATLALARAGHGIARSPDFVAASDVERGVLVEVLKDYRPPPLDIQVVYLPSTYMPSRVRALLDFLSQRFDR